MDGLPRGVYQLLLVNPMTHARGIRFRTYILPRYEKSIEESY